MSKQHDTQGDQRKKSTRPGTVPKGKRKHGKEDNTPQEIAGTSTPGLKKDEDMPVATERKKRLKGSKKLAKK